MITFVTREIFHNIEIRQGTARYLTAIKSSSTVFRVLRERHREIVLSLPVRRSRKILGSRLPRAERSPGTSSRVISPWSPFSISGDGQP